MERKNGKSAAKKRETERDAGDPAAPERLSLRMERPGQATRSGGKSLAEGTPPPDPWYR